MRFSRNIRVSLEMFIKELYILKYIQLVELMLNDARWFRHELREY